MSLHPDEGPLVESVERRTGLSPQEFRQQYLLPRRPVILTDASCKWAARELFQPAWFREHHGDHPLHVGGRKWRLADYLDVLEASTAAEPAPYPCKVDIPQQFPKLMRHVSPRLPLARPDRLGSRLLPRKLLLGCNTLEIFFGGPGGKFPYLHYDYLHLHAWITQTYGDKEFTIYSPDQNLLMYADPNAPWRSQIENHHDPDLSRWPLFGRATAQRVVVRAGETLFIPCGWWHTARSLTVTISVAFDQLEPSNWPDFRRDLWLLRSQMNPRKAALADAWLATVEPIFIARERLSA